MPKTREEKYSHVENCISYTFINKELLREAVHHGSEISTGIVIHNGNGMLSMLGIATVDLIRLEQEWHNQASTGTLDRDDSQKRRADSRVRCRPSSKRNEYG